MPNVFDHEVDGGGFSRIDGDFPLMKPRLVIGYCSTDAGVFIPSKS